MKSSRSVPADTIPRTRPAASANALTSARIEADLETFRRDGGRIEVMEITRPRDRADEAPRAPSSQPPRMAKEAGPVPAARKRRS